MLFNPVLSALLMLGTASAQVSTKSLVTCITKQGSKSSASVKTASKVLTIPWYALKVTTSTPSRTTTPATSTIIVSTTVTSSTTTTLPVETDTITTTSTEISTVPEITTATITSDSTAYTTITITDTTTIAASAGFVPIESNVPNSQKRHVADDLALEERQDSRKAKLYVKDGKPAFDPPRFPQSVNCAGIVAVITTKVVTKTASTTRVITAPTPLATSTTTFSTSTVITETPPHASTTVTVITTVLTTSTSTYTETATNVVSATVSIDMPQATYYAACAENNLISTVNGVPIDGAYEGNGQFSYVGDTATAYDCCVVGINTPNAAGTFWFTQPGSSNCYVMIQNSGQCTPDTIAGTLSLSSWRSWVVSNGYCGYWGFPTQ